MALLVELWGEAALPTWGDDSPADLLALFRRYCDGERSAGDDLSRLLMHVIAIRFASHPDWQHGLVRVGLRPDDVAQLTLMHVLKKADRLWRYLGATDQPKLLLAALYTTADRYVLQEIEGKRRKRHKELPASECYGDQPGGAGAFGGIADPLSGAVPADDPTTLVVLEYLKGKEDELTDDIQVRGTRAPMMIAKLYSALCDGIVRRHEVIPHARLSKELQREVSTELHCLVASRLVRALSRFDVT